MFVFLNVDIVAVLAGGLGLAQRVSAREQTFVYFLQWQWLAGEKYLALNKSEGWATCSLSER